MRDWILYLYDIKDAITSIQDFISGMDFEEFKTDKKTMSAVRDQIMIIGEAAGHLPPEIISNYPEIPWRDIVGMRNVLIHSYFRTDPELLFLAASERINSLEPVIDKIFKEYSRE